MQLATPEMVPSRIGIGAMLDRLIAALADPARRERAIVAVLAGYCALWTLYGAIAKGSQDIHFDMGEMVAWSRETFWGTPKHPPFGAWLVRYVQPRWLMALVGLLVVGLSLRTLLRALAG